MMRSSSTPPSLGLAAERPAAVGLVASANGTAAYFSSSVVPLGEDSRPATFGGAPGQHPTDTLGEAVAPAQASLVDWLSEQGLVPDLLAPAGWAVLWRGVRSLARGIVTAERRGDVCIRDLRGEIREVFISEGSIVCPSILGQVVDIYVDAVVTAVDVNQKVVEVTRLQAVKSALLDCWSRYVRNELEAAASEVSLTSQTPRSSVAAWGSELPRPGLLASARGGEHLKVTDRVMGATERVPVVPLVAPVGHSAGYPIPCGTTIRDRIPPDSNPAGFGLGFSKDNFDGPAPNNSPARLSRASCVEGQGLDNVHRNVYVDAGQLLQGMVKAFQDGGPSLASGSKSGSARFVESPLDEVFSGPTDEVSVESFKQMVEYRVRVHNLRNFEKYQYGLKCLSKVLQREMEAMVEASHVQDPEEMWRMMWSALETRFKVESGTWSAVAKLWQMRQGRDEKFTTWASRVNRSVLQVRTQGRVVPDEDKTAILIQGALPEVQRFLGSLGRSVRRLGFDEVVEEVNYQDRFLAITQTSFSSSGAPQTGSDRRRGEVKKADVSRSISGVADKVRRATVCYGCGQSDHRRVDCPTAATNVCSHCKKLGHVKDTCWQLHPDMRPRRGTSREPTSRGQGAVAKVVEYGSDGCPEGDLLTLDAVYFRQAAPRSAPSLKQLSAEEVGCALKWRTSAVCIDLYYGTLPGDKVSGLLDTGASTGFIDESLAEDLERRGVTRRVALSGAVSIKLATGGDAKEFSHHECIVPVREDREKGELKYIPFLVVKGLSDPVILGRQSLRILGKAWTFKGLGSERENLIRAAWQKAMSDLPPTLEKVSPLTLQQDCRRVEAVEFEELVPELVPDGAPEWLDTLSCGQCPWKVTNRLNVSFLGNELQDVCIPEKVLEVTVVPEAVALCLLEPEDITGNLCDLPEVVDLLGPWSDGGYSLWDGLSISRLEEADEILRSICQRRPAKVKNTEAHFLRLVELGPEDPRDSPTQKFRFVTDWPLVEAADGTTNGWDPRRLLLKLTDEQRRLYDQEFEMYVARSWWKENKRPSEADGEATVFPVLAEDKSTPVRPVIDSRAINRRSPAASNSRSRVAGATLQLRGLLRPGDTVEQDDLSKAFYRIATDKSIRINTGTAKYLSDRLVFGLSAGPAVLEAVLDCIFGLVRPERFSVKIVRLMDDYLKVGDAAAVDGLNCLLDHVLGLVGFVVPADKRERWSRDRETRWLGAFWCWDGEHLSCRREVPTVDRVNFDALTKRVAFQLAGQFCDITREANECRGRLHADKIRQIAGSVSPWDRPMEKRLGLLCQKHAAFAISCWEEANRQKHMPIFYKVRHLVISSDASNEAYAVEARNAATGELLVAEGKLFSKTSTTWHANRRETYALLQGLHRIYYLWKHHAFPGITCLTVRSDSRTAVSVSRVDRKTSKSLEGIVMDRLRDLVAELVSHLNRQGIRVAVRHVPAEENLVADRLSRPSDDLSKSHVELKGGSVDLYVKRFSGEAEGQPAQRRQRGGQGADPEDEPSGDNEIRFSSFGRPIIAPVPWQPENFLRKTLVPRPVAFVGSVPPSGAALPLPVAINTPEYLTEEPTSHHTQVNDNQYPTSPEWALDIDNLHYTTEEVAELLKKEWVVPVPCGKDSFRYESTANWPKVTIGSVLVPNAHEADLVEYVHRYGHPGREGLVQMVRGWGLVVPGLRRALRKHVCSGCLSSKGAYSPKLGHVYQSRRPFESVVVDFMEPEQGNCALVILDRATGWCWAVATKSMGADEVHRAFLEWFTRNGVPRYIQSDNFTSFLSSKVQGLLEQHGVAHIGTPVYHPQSQGDVERRIRRLLEATRAAMCSPEPLRFEEAVAWAAYCANRTGSPSPFQRLFQCPEVPPFQASRLEVPVADSAEISSGTAVLERSVGAKKLQPQWIDRGRSVFARVGRHVYRLVNAMGVVDRLVVHRSHLKPLTQPLFQVRGPSGDFGTRGLDNHIPKSVSLFSVSSLSTMPVPLVDCRRIEIEELRRDPEAAQSSGWSQEVVAALVPGERSGAPQAPEMEVMDANDGHGFGVSSLGGVPVRAPVSTESDFTSERVHGGIGSGMLINQAAAPGALLDRLAEGLVSGSQRRAVDSGSRFSSDKKRAAHYIQPCHNCGHPGHNRAACPRALNCKSCWMFNHTAAQCQSYWNFSPTARTRWQVERGCERCGERGHEAAAGVCDFPIPLDDWRGPNFAGRYGWPEGRVSIGRGEGCHSPGPRCFDSGPDSSGRGAYHHADYSHWRSTGDQATTCGGSRCAPQWGSFAHSGTEWNSYTGGSGSWFDAAPYEATSTYYAPACEFAREDHHATDRTHYTPANRDWVPEWTYGRNWADSECAGRWASWGHGWNRDPCGDPPAKALTTVTWAEKRASPPRNVDAKRTKPEGGKSSSPGADAQGPVVSHPSYSHNNSSVLMKSEDPASPLPCAVVAPAQVEMTAVKFECPSDTLAVAPGPRSVVDKLHSVPAPKTANAVRVYPVDGGWLPASTLRGYLLGEIILEDLPSVAAHLDLLVQEFLSLMGVGGGSKWRPAGSPPLTQTRWVYLIGHDREGLWHALETDQSFGSQWQYRELTGALEAAIGNLNRVVMFDRCHLAGLRAENLGRLMRKFRSRQRAVGAVLWPRGEQSPQVQWIFESFEDLVRGKELRIDDSRRDRSSSCPPGQSGRSGERRGADVADRR
jgi:hypothetical protein